MTKTRYTVVLAVAVAIGLLTWLGVSSERVNAQTGFSASAVKGSYGFNFEGDINANARVAASGLITTDGLGAASGTETMLVYGRGVYTRSFTGTYTVNSDGTGSMELWYTTEEAGLPSSARYSFVVVKNKAELQGIRMDLATTATFTQQ